MGRQKGTYGQRAQLGHGAFRKSHGALSVSPERRPRRPRRKHRPTGPAEASPACQVPPGPPQWLKSRETGAQRGRGCHLRLPGGTGAQPEWEPGLQSASKAPSPGARARPGLPAPPHLSWLLHGSWRQGRCSPCTTRASNRNLGAQKPRAPVTKAMAVTPRVDHTKLQLQEKAPWLTPPERAVAAGPLCSCHCPPRSPRLRTLPATAPATPPFSLGLPPSSLQDQLSPSRKAQTQQHVLQEAAPCPHLPPSATPPPSRMALYQREREPGPVRTPHSSKS